MKKLRIITRLNIGDPAQHAVFLTSGSNEGVFESKLLAGKTNQTYLVFLVEFRITESGKNHSPRGITSQVQH